MELTRPPLGGLHIRPSSLRLVALLARRGPMTAARLSQLAGRSHTSTCNRLRTLLGAGLVLRHATDAEGAWHVWLAAPLPRAAPPPGPRADREAAETLPRDEADR